jgi:hypothetical protein
MLGHNALRIVCGSELSDVVLEFAAGAFPVTAGKAKRLDCEIDCESAAVSAVVGDGPEKVATCLKRLRNSLKLDLKFLAGPAFGWAQQARMSPLRWCLLEPQALFFASGARRHSSQVLTRLHVMPDQHRVAC